MTKSKAVPAEVAPVEVAPVENLTPLENIMAYLNGRRLKDFEEMKNLCTHFGYEEGVWNLQAHFVMLRANGNNQMPYELDKPKPLN